MNTPHHGHSHNHAPAKLSLHNPVAGHGNKLVRMFRWGKWFWAALFLLSAIALGYFAKVALKGNWQDGVGFAALIIAIIGIDIVISQKRRH